MNLRRRKQDARVEVSTSSLNDILFFLLLFFLIVATITNPNVVKLILPTSSSGQSISKKTIAIAITKDLQYYVEKKRVALAALSAILQKYQQLSTDLTIVLYVDKSVAIQQVVQVMDVAQKLNMKLVLATEAK